MKKCRCESRFKTRCPGFCTYVPKYYVMLLMKFEPHNNPVRKRIKALSQFYSWGKCVLEKVSNSFEVSPCVWCVAAAGICSYLEPAVKEQRGGCGEGALSVKGRPSAGVGSLLKTWDMQHVERLAPEQKASSTHHPWRGWYSELERLGFESRLCRSLTCGLQQMLSCTKP